MKRIPRKRAIQIGVAVLLLALIVWAFIPDPVPVQTATVTRGLLEVVVEEEGETRVEDRYVVTSPVAAFVRRIELEVGDRVDVGTPVARLEPPRSGILDPRAQAEAAARVSGARAGLEQADIVAQQASTELARVERLAAGGAATPQAVEQATAEAARAIGARDAARAEMAAAQAAQRNAAPATLQVQDVVRAPAAGRVLVIHQESGGHVNPGEPLLEVGNPEQLQVSADVLSQDAVRIQPGTRVILDQWGGENPLEAVVWRVEPEGFTEVSALGVEERRVTVRANITSPPEHYAGLGPGYRVLARFIVWSAPNALQVPTAALFRHDDGWAVFVVNGGRAALRTVTLGRNAGLAAQILDGLEAGEIVIVHPGNDIEDGSRVSVDD